MTPKLTILVPNYNRPLALSRLLQSVFRSIDLADASWAVFVLVIDDFSTEPVDHVLKQFAGRSNFSFRLQNQRQGNAEAAFLNSLEAVSTEYTWLLGNDDQVAPASVGTILKLIQYSEFGFVLLNPRVTTVSGATTLPLGATVPTVRYTTCRDLFSDWGFVTSTTTFPCIVFRTEPVAQLHARHHLDRVATVYSHSFTLFSALHNDKGLYVSAPLVEFSLNQRRDEQEKLQRQSPGYMHAYHQTVGLGRLIRAAARCSGNSIAVIGSSVEDEFDKEKLLIGQTTLSHFVTFFVLSQLMWEQTNIVKDSSPARHLSREDLSELSETIGAFENMFLVNTFAAAVAIHSSGTMRARSKIARLSLLKSRIPADARRKLQDRSMTLRASGPRKLLAPEHEVTVLCGLGGDLHGRAL